MKFYNLFSIVSAQKVPIALSNVTDSFRVASTRREPYVEPSFEKSVFEHERPTVILVSAVGATGKTTLAQVLSSRTGMPLLDLSKHQPVGGDSLTGLLTTAFPVEDLSRVFQAIQQGTFGIIIDAIDEGRSKTTEKGFEAFLDDVARRCRGAQNVAFVLLGRTQVLEECWLHLSSRDVSIGLVSIAHFNLEAARKYIDDFSEGHKSGHAAEYASVRDMILKRLSGAFADSTSAGEGSFLSFIGYPPVLDAIVTLLQKEQNYHKLAGELQGSEVKDVEIELLNWISSYILRREREQKVIPNILVPLIHGRPEEDRQKMLHRVFTAEEQAVRLVSYCLGRFENLARAGEPSVDEKYEKQLMTFLPEHPFIAGRQFRNAVFEAVALSSLILSAQEDATRLALEYVGTHKFNYHMIYLLNKMAGARRIPISALRIIVGSALEFRSKTSTVELSIDGPELEGFSISSAAVVDIEIEITMGTREGQSSTFEFQSDLRGTDPVNLGRTLAATYVSLPCDVVISGGREIELTAPVELTCRKLILDSPSLILHPNPVGQARSRITIEAETMESAVESLTTNQVDLTIALLDRSGVCHPLVRHVGTRNLLAIDPASKEKYVRLRRILMQFRSHSRGALARYKHKIENERILRNEMGASILRRLLRDGILTLDGSFYFLQPDNVNHHLGVSWIDLREYRSSVKLQTYLQTIS